MRPIHVGLSDSDRKAAVALLNVTLASESLLMIKTKKCRWDAVGTQYAALHDMWMRQCARLGRMTQKTADRIRQLGGVPVGSAASFIECGCIREHPSEELAAAEAVDLLLADHETIACVVREHTARCLDILGDLVSAEFLTQVLKAHEEMAWELRSVADVVPQLWHIAEIPRPAPTLPPLNPPHKTDAPRSGTVATAASSADAAGARAANDTHWAD